MSQSVKDHQNSESAELVRGLIDCGIAELDFYHLASLHKLQAASGSQIKSAEAGNIFGSFFTEAPIAYFVLSQQGYVIDANLLAAEYWGVDSTQLKGIDFSGMIDPKEIQGFRSAIECIKVTGHRMSLELKCKRIDGSAFWGRFDFISPRFSADGKMILCSVIDISAHHILDDAIRKTAVGLSAVTGVGFFTRLLHYLISFRDVDAAVITTLIPPYNFRSIAIVSHLPCEEKLQYSRKKVMTEFIQGKISGLHEPCGEHLGPILKFFKAKSGLSLFLCDAERQISGELAIVTRGFFEDSVLIANILKIVSVRAAAELDRLKIEQQLSEYRDRLEILVKERTIELERKTDEFRVNNQRLAQEIERREQAESVLQEAMLKAEEATRVKSAFLANMSHEIRTPMNGIIGMTSLFETRELSEKNRRYLEQIRESGQSLLRILNDILDVSKLESEGVHLEFIEFDLRELLLNIFTGHSPLAQKKDLYFVIDFPYDQPSYFKSDPVRIRQVLENLVNNAIKFTEHGGIFVKIRFASKEKVLISEITDTGIGLSEEQQKSIFERFFQADSSTTRRFGGTGLGLAICKKLTHLLGGDISFTSTAGVGSNFKFIIPLESCDKPQNDICTYRLHEKSAIYINLTNTQISEAWCRLLTSLGFLCQPAKQYDLSPIEASRQFEKVILLVDRYQEITEEFLGLATKVDLVLLGPLESHPEQLWRSVSLMPKATLIENFFLEKGWLVRGNIQTKLTVDLPSSVTSKQLEVLLAEDNLVNCEVASGMLESLGCHVKIAHDGREAVDLYQKEDFEVVFMDCLMPNMDGFEALKLVRSSAKPGGYVIALTANAMAGDREKCLAAGFDDYLSKPLNFQDLGAIVNKVLQKKSTYRGELRQQ